MAVRQNTNRKPFIPRSTSFYSGKVTPVVKDIPIHSPEVKNQKAENFEEPRIVAGSRAADRDDYLEAIKQFSLIKPGTTKSFYLCGCARLELRQYSETRKAIEDFSQCIELSSQTTKSLFASEPWYKRGFAHQNIGKNEDALRDYTEFINRCRSLGEEGKDYLHRGLLGRGLTYYAMRELDLAFQDINDANRLTNNDNPYYLCCRASIYSSKYEYIEARKDLERAAKKGGNQDVETLFQRAFVHSELGNHDEALQDLKKALNLSQHSSRQEADILFRCGVSEYALQNREQALRCFEKTIELNPCHGRAYFRKGMIQVEKGEFKEALKTLTEAHKLSPHESDILFERAIVNRQLGKLDDAAHDYKRGLQLGSSSLATFAMLEDRIKKLREEIDLRGDTPQSHLELGMAYDGLFTQKKGAKDKLEYYKEAVVEYKAAIEIDQENYYPQTRALLALCQKKMNNHIEAHNMHLEFYNILIEHKEAVVHWKAFLESVKEKDKLDKLEPHLDKAAVNKLDAMETNRLQMDNHVEEFENDKEDEHKSQLVFYERLRIDLSNLLSAIALSSLPSDIIAHNLQGTPGKVGQIVGVLGEGLSFVPEVGSILSGVAKVGAKVLQKADYDVIKNRLKTIGSVGDMTEQIKIAQLVAQHLCKQYRSQLLCLKPNNHSQSDTDDLSKELLSSRWWWCCCCQWLCSKKTAPSDYNETAEKIATFALEFIIQEIRNGTMKVSWKNKNTSKEKQNALAAALVLTVSRAHASKTKSYFRFPCFNRKDNLPIDRSKVSKMLEKFNETKTLLEEWELYSFFQGPGIYYSTEDDTNKIFIYGSDPSMKPHIYGYRLGSAEEVNQLKKLIEKNK